MNFYHYPLNNFSWQSRTDFFNITVWTTFMAWTSGSSTVQDLNKNGQLWSYFDSYHNNLLKKIIKKINSESEHDKSMWLEFVRLTCCLSGKTLPGFVENRVQADESLNPPQDVCVPAQDWKFMLFLLGPLCENTVKLYPFFLFFFLLLSRNESLVSTQ